MYKWFQSIRLPLRSTGENARRLVAGHWRNLIADCPFLAPPEEADQLRLETLSVEFLAQKEFHGAQGLVVTDAMAVAIAAQACLVVLNMGTARQALTWYDDFVGIVVHPGEMLAPREVVDEAGVVHRYKEALAGEAMHRGPITLNWRDVSNAGQTSAQGMNLVVHEFAHKIDMRSGSADGCPPLPNGFMGAVTEKQAHQIWLASMQSAFVSFRERVILADRFGQPPVWLDSYGATSLAEFFAVACEAYFVNRTRFAMEFPALMPIFDAFFLRGKPTATP